ncbi:hypothetical protein CAI16_15595 [Virgibacillus dokdonensis]|uniref:Uncharacterized protein n=1 Tax=Virgibacillus dokdonensis TaxID=302167 RepID=A0A3E0WJR9_9BACI|nr:hypothetical protein CAI16_15595 [Virgibacillus dokdonensis]
MRLSARRVRIGPNDPKTIIRNTTERPRYLTYYLRSLLIHEFVQTKLLGTEGGDSSGKSMRLETPQRAFFASEEAQSALRKASACSGK